MTVNLDNGTDIYWSDTSNTTTATYEHPIDRWINATTIQDMFPSTDLYVLAPTGFLYSQMADRTIAGFNITYAAENTTLLPEETIANDLKGLGGTHIAAAMYTLDDTVTICVLYQTEGNDITESVRPYTPNSRSVGSWTRSPVLVPDE